MADLTSVEKVRLESILEMDSGYVLNFSKRTLREFVLEINNKDIYDEVYSFNGDSKANRLRAFWHKESNLLLLSRF